MDTQNILNRVKELRKQYNINQANNLLKSGWILLEIEQQIENDGSMVTAYILGRTEEEVEE